MTPAGLAGEVVPVNRIGARERDRMFTLLDQHFVGVARDRFESDLEAKDHAVLLRDAVSGELAGFSTLAAMRVRVETESVRAFFSGDTIIQRSRWGHAELARIWLRLLFRQLVPAEDGPAYWFLICSGFRTYRFLPVFFRSFLPAAGIPPDHRSRRILDALAQSRFPREYDVRTGIVHLRHPARLRPGLGEIDDGRRRDPHVAFFTESNPGHAGGDDLACLTELAPGNLTAAGRRCLGLARERGH